MSTQPKLSGKYSHWLNIKPEAENENPICINWVCEVYGSMPDMGQKCISTKWVITEIPRIIRR